MITSMTGYASLTRETEAATLTVTVKSVNHRYLDVQVRVPMPLTEMEAVLRSAVQRHAARGRVELTVGVQMKTPPAVDVELNGRLVAALAAVAETARQQSGIAGDVTVGDLLRFPHVVTIREQSPDTGVRETVTEAVRGATDEVLREWETMRRREGAFLARDLTERARAVAELVDQIVREAASGEGALRDRLASRVDELRGQLEVDENAVAQEVVRWAARSDIHEEVSRLRGHLEHLAELSEASGACGRKLDFLVQEMNREVNTIGSKAEGREMAQQVVATKAELEKMREQIQNVE